MPHFHQKEHPDQRQRMLETPIPQLIPALAVPTIVSMLVTSIYNMADTYFVSQLNTSASGAVGVVFSLMAIIQAVGFTVGMGSGSIASRLLGQERREEADVYASTGVLAALVLGLAMAGAGMAFREELMWLLGSTATIYPYALDYAVYIILGAPVMILSFTLNNLLRWQGKANLSVFGLATGGVLNMALDPIFIYGFRMGIGGAGAATLLSQCVSLVILTSFFLLKKSELKVAPGKISRSPRTYLAILKQGMPSFFRQGVLSAATMALNYNAKIYGDAAVAGFLLAPAIMTQFRRDDALVIAIGTRTFRYQCCTLPLGAVLVFANMFFQSLGKSWRAVLLAICRQGLYIPLVYLMSGRFGLTGLECTQAVADLLAFALSAAVIAHYFKTEFGKEG